MRANIAVAVDGGSLVEAVIAALAALINPRAWLTRSDKAPPFCGGVVRDECEKAGHDVICVPHTLQNFVAES